MCSETTSNSREVLGTNIWFNTILTDIHLLIFGVMKDMSLLRRTAAEKITVRTPKKQALKMLVRHLERLKGWRSAPLSVLKENPYSSDFLEGLSKPLERG